MVIRVSMLNEKKGVLPDKSDHFLESIPNIASI